MTSEAAEGPRRCERPVRRERLVGRVVESVAEVVVVVRMIVACPDNGQF